MTQSALTSQSRHYDLFRTGYEGIEYYAELQELDKDLSPYFAGRDDILSQIENNCTEVWRRHLCGQQQVTASTRVIYGAPGAGKTTTLRHLRQQWAKGSYVTSQSDGSPRKGPTPLMMYFSGAMELSDTAGFFEDLADSVIPGKGDSLFSKISRTLRLSGEFNLGVATGSIEKESTESEQQKELRRNRAIRTFLKSVPLRKWKRPVVIGIDETQNLPRDRDSAVGQLIQCLHDNVHNLPLVVVMGGLSDSVTRVKQLGLTRLSEDHTHSLGCLNKKELKEFKTGFLEHFDLDLGSCERQFDAIIESSNGWPAHLQNGLQSFAKGYVEAKGDIEKVDFDAVHKMNQEKRTRYYGQRMSSEMKNTYIFLTAVMNQVTRNQKADIVHMISEQNQKWVQLSDARRSLPEGMTAKNYYDHLIHNGALQESDDGWVECPIPSFRQYILEFPNPD